MKRYIYLVVILLFFIECKERLIHSHDNVRYYPSMSYFSDTSKLVEIELDNTNLDFKNITDLVDKIYENDSIPNFMIKDKQMFRNIIPFRNDYGLIVEKNKLEITEDSILIDENYPISKLSQILERHYENEGKIPYYSDSPQRAFIEISLDSSKSGSALFKSLNNLAIAFDQFNSKHKDTLELKIALSYFRQIPPPPPK